MEPAGEQCPICRDALTDAWRPARCRLHAFHKECLIRSLAARERCPYCSLPCTRIVSWDGRAELAAGRSWSDALVDYLRSDSAALVAWFFVKSLVASAIFLCCELGVFFLVGKYFPEQMRWFAQLTFEVTDPALRVVSAVLSVAFRLADAARDAVAAKTCSIAQRVAC